MTLHRMDSVLVGAFALLMLSPHGGPALAAPFLAAPSAGSPGQIEIIDVESLEIVDRITTLEDAHGLAATPDGRLLVTASLAERVEGATPEKPAGVSAADHAAHHGGGSVDEAGAGEAAIIDLAARSVVRRIDLPAGVHHVAVSPDSRSAAFTHPGGGAVSIVDLETFAVVASPQVGDDPNYAAFSPDGAHLYVSAAGEDQVVVLETRTWSVARRLDVGASPEHLVLDRDGGRLFVNLVGDDAIAVLNIASGKVGSIFPLGGVLHGIAVTDDDRGLIASLMDRDEIVRIDLAGGEIIRRSTGDAPYHVTTAPGAGKAFVSHASGPGLSVFDQDSLTVLGAVETGDVGHQMAPLTLFIDHRD